MNVWHDIDPARISPEDFLAVIEIPKGSKKKYELDKETGEETVGWSYKSHDTYGKSNRKRRRRASNLADDLTREGIEAYFEAKQRELEVPQQRLVINRFNAEYFGSLSAGREDAGGLRDLDDVIDQSGVRLIGIVPEDRQMTAAFQRGCVPADDLPGMTALSRIAARMDGVSVPLSL